MGRGVRILDAEDYEPLMNTPNPNGDYQVYGV
jgi:hypothetical protein